MQLIRKIKNYLFWHLRINELYNRMPDEQYLKIRYKRKMNRALRLENPVLFSEKIQWLKLYNRRPEYITMVDKLSAKEYVSSVLGPEYITPTIGVWDHFDQIDFETLPQQFVLKCTHNSGGLVICKDKAEVNWKKAGAQLKKCLKRDYYLSSREWPYKDVPRRIIAEEYMENGDEGLHDYKIWCFNGEPAFIQYITGRIGNQTYEGFYDLGWNLQNFSYHNPLMKELVEKPVCLDKLIQAARTLAKDQPFVRCDFYVLEDGSIRFGEITFYPMSGMERWNPEKMDRILGDMIDLRFGSKE